MMVVGPSGSGKSYFVKKYCEQYIKKLKIEIYMYFLNLKEDSSLDTLKNKLKRFKLDSSLHEDPIDVEDLKESCVIFDDTDCIADKKIRQAVITLLDQCLEVGRHWKTDCSDYISFSLR
jgi:septin family protein